MNPQVFSEGSSPLVTFLASFLIWFMFAGIFYLWVVGGKLNKAQAFQAFLAGLIAFAVSETIKTLFPAIRPFEVNGEPPLTMTVPFDGGFPSGHSSVAFALASGVWLTNKKIGKVFVAVAALVALGRVLGNVHYVGDVVAGSMLGASTGLVLEKSNLQKLLKK